jgi:hypothetical protein
MASSSSSTLVVLAPRALLPGSDQPQAATIEIDTVSGKITAVHQGLKPELGSDGQTLRVDETKILLPGLIE